MNNNKFYPDVKSSVSFPEIEEEELLFATVIDTGSWFGVLTCNSDFADALLLQPKRLKIRKIFTINNVFFFHYDISLNIGISSLEGSFILPLILAIFIILSKEVAINSLVLIKPSELSAIKNIREEV